MPNGGNHIAPQNTPLSAHSANASSSVSATISVPGGVREHSRTASRMVRVQFMVALVPISAAAARAILRHWLPTGDTALVAIRSHDVFSRHVPLLGLWSSGSLTAGTHFNHPGPLLFDWLALPATLFGRGSGLIVGVAALDAAALAGVAVVGWRLGGPVAAAVTTGFGTALSWTLGSEVLVDPIHNHAMLLPFLLFVTLVWATSCGDVAALPWAAGVGSFVLQADVPYAYVVPTLGVWAAVGLALDLRRRRRHEPVDWPRLRRHAVRAGAVTALVLLACWTQPLVEEVTSDGAGNLTRIVRVASSSAPRIGFDRGSRIASSVLSLPPWWFRPSFGRTLWPQRGWRSPSTPSVALSLVVVVIVLAGCAWVARRRHDHVSSRAVLTAAIGLGAAFVSAGSSLESVFGVAVGHFRWLWPLGTFVWLAVSITIVRGVTGSPRARGLVIAAVSIITVVLVALNVPRNDQGRSSPDWPVPIVRDLGRQMRVLKGTGPLLVESHGFIDPYGTAILGELQHWGVPFVVREKPMLRQVGPARRYTGRNARGVLSVVIGDAADTAPKGARRVAFHSGLSSRERAERATLESQLRAYISERGLPPAVRDRKPSVGSETAPTIDELFRSRRLVALVRDGQLVLEPAWAPAFRRYADLQSRWDERTVALFLRAP